MKFGKLLVTLMLLACLPLRVQAVHTQDRVLNIYKTTDREDGGLPLANISFDLYHVQTGALAARLVTDDRGIASYNFTEAGQPDGVYLIVEQHNPAIRSPRSPAYISVPGVQPDGSPAYTVSIASSNVAEKGPNIQTDVISLGNNSGSFDIGQPQTWIIRGDIPAAIGTAREYVITDVLDSRLSFVPDSAAVKLAARSGEELALEAGIHYTLSQSRAMDLLQVSLTPEGMEFAARHQGQGDAQPEIRVYFDTSINTRAAMGSTIPNDAQLSYVNSAGVSYQEASDIPEVHTGGLNLQITDENGRPVDGAAFLLAREAGQADLEQEGQSRGVLEVKGRQKAVVFPKYFTTKDLTEEPSNRVVTGPDGKAALYGLAYGIYYLAPIPEPEGAALKSEPITVQISETSHLTAEDGWMDTEGNVVDKTINLPSAGMDLPDAGGRETVLFFCLGFFILLAACCVLYWQKNNIWNKKLLQNWEKLL